MPTDNSDTVGLVVRGVILLACIAAVILAPLLLGESYATGLVSGGVLGAALLEGIKWFFSK